MWHIIWALLFFIPNDWYGNIAVSLFLSGLIAVGLGYIISTTTLVSMIFKSYATMLNIFGIVLLTIGAFLYGCYGTEQDWKQKVDEIQAKYEVAQHKINDNNSKIETKIIYRTKVIKEKAKQNDNLILQNSSQLNAECPNVDLAIKLLDSAASGTISSGTGSPSSQTSGLGKGTTK